MIVHKNLNIMGGRLGNQLFKCAALISLSSHTGYQWGILNNNKPDNVMRYWNIEYPYSIIDNWTPVYHYQWEDSLMFDTEFFTIKDNTSIDSYVQSEKYFSELNIKQFFMPRQEFQIPEYVEKIKSYYKDHRIVTVHVRKSDYKECKYFDILTKEYYHKVFDMTADTNNLYIIITDDITWLRENITLPAKHIISQQLDLYDFYLFGCGDIQVLANSSFSWWASYFSNKLNKIVYAPSMWAENKYTDKLDIKRKEWILC